MGHRRIRRWGDNDKHFGPILYSRDEYTPTYGITLESGTDNNPDCCLMVRGFGHTIIIDMPQLINPTHIDNDYHRQSFGVTYSDGFLQVFYGPQTFSSDTTKNWCKFLPWTEWRFHRFSLYDTYGKHYWTEFEAPCIGASYNRFHAQQEAQKQCPSVIFEFNDFDGEVIQVRTQIHEREWLFGVGWFKWLSNFRTPKIVRSLDLEFTKETGRRKGSWKGGTIGHSIEFMPGDTHETAFRRYCDLHDMTFVRTVAVETYPMTVYNGSVNAEAACLSGR